MRGLSPRFEAVIIDYYGSVGRRWLARLDEKVAACCSRWELTPTCEPPMMGGRSLVIPCRTRKGREVILKLCPDPYPLGRECDGLRHWEPSGRTVRVLRGSGARGAMVLDRLHGPSPQRLTEELLVEVAEVVAAIHNVPDPLPTIDCEQHIASVMGHCIGRLSHAEVAKHVNTDDFKCALDRALALAVSRDCANDVLLHGDLHLENLVRTRAGKLLAIDPKPFLGERALDLALLARDCGPVDSLEQRIQSIADACGADERRVRAWTRVLLLDTAISHARWQRSDERSIAAMMAFCRAGA